MRTGAALSTGFIARKSWLLNRLRAIGTNRPTDAAGSWVQAVTLAGELIIRLLNDTC